MDVASIVSAVMPFLVPAAPYLLKVGEKAAEEAGAMIGSGAWEIAKKLWKQLSSKSVEQPGLIPALQEVALEPANGDSQQILGMYVKKILEKDKALAQELAQTVAQASVPASTYNHTHIQAQYSPMVTVASGSFTAHNVDLSVNKAPTIQEIEQKEERNKIVTILNKFDRLAITANMHEENFAWMVKSLEELRVDIQTLGITTIRDSAIRHLFESIKHSIANINAIASFVRTYGQRDGWQNSILDLRSMGMTAGMAPNSMSPLMERYNMIYHFLRPRIDNQFKYAKNIDQAKIPNNYSDLQKIADERNVPIAEVRDLMLREQVANNSLNTNALINDFIVVYFFGCMDQIKMEIHHKLKTIRTAFDAHE